MSSQSPCDGGMRALGETPQLPSVHRHIKKHKFDLEHLNWHRVKHQVILKFPTDFLTALYDFLTSSQYPPVSTWRMYHAPMRGTACV